jgi:hypothetical protein
VFSASLSDSLSLSRSAMDGMVAAEKALVLGVAVVVEGFADESTLGDN